MNLRFMALRYAPTAIPHHVLIKLLQAGYFTGQGKRVTVRGRSYIVAQYSSDGQWITFIHMEIHEVPPTADMPFHEYVVQDHATTFRQWQAGERHCNSSVP